MRTVQKIGTWVYYQDLNGNIRRINPSYAEDLPLSDIIQPTINTALNQTQLATAAAGSYLGYYFVSCTSALGSGNDYTIVLDTYRAGKGGFSIDTNKYASCYVQHPGVGNVPQLFFGDARSSTGSVYQGETGNNDNGGAITMTLRTGVAYFNSFFHKSWAHSAMISAQAGSGNYNMTFGYALSTNRNVFTNTTVSLNPQAGTWGVGIWDPTQVWGGASNVETIVPIEALARGFKFQFYHSGIDQPVTVDLFTLIHEIDNQVNY